MWLKKPDGAATDTRLRSCRALEPLVAHGKECNIHNDQQPEAPKEKKRIFARRISPGSS
jgi:hypothetical protein